MQRLFIQKIRIDEVRHLHDISIPISDSDVEFKHVIFTGKNGSGKTSVLDAIAGYIDAASRGDAPALFRERGEQSAQILAYHRSHGSSDAELYETERNVEYWKRKSSEAASGLSLTFNIAEASIQRMFEQGDCVFAYFKAQRVFNAVEPKQIEKVVFKDRYAIYETPRDQFVKYMLDLKMTQALAAINGKHERAAEIERWFNGLQCILRDIYEDPELTIDFDESTYRFSINESGRVPFDFNSASDGFSAVLDIIVSLMLRMTKGDSRLLNFDTPGIVLVDEVENHLHLSLQRSILPYLADMFPNVQFIVSTHSPFVVASVANAVVYDLENSTYVKDGLADSTYGSVVEGYFNVDALSAELRDKYERYKDLATRASLTDDNLIELTGLETYLDEIPDYLAFDITTEYRKLKLELRARGGRS